MNKKFMKVRRIAVPTLTLIIMASQLMGCAANTQETMKMMEGNQEAGAADLDSDKATSNNEQTGDIKGKEEELGWTELASLETMPEMRNAWDEIAGIQKTDTGKEGMFYTNSKGENDNNNTLMGALSNELGFLKVYANLSDTAEPTLAMREPFAKAASESYVDIDEISDMDDEKINTAFLAGLNAYFNLLPDTEQGKANMNESLTRKEFMAMIYRADTPVEEVTEDTDFTKAVGNSEYNVYAQNLENNSYLTTDNGDLNETTYNSAISRAEAIYMIVNRYYRDELLQTCQGENVTGYTYTSTGDQTEIQFTDAKLNAGANENTLEALNEAIKNPDSGMPKYLYGSLVVAARHNIISTEEDSLWDETVTKRDTLQLLVNTYNSIIGGSGANILTANTEEFVTNEQQEEAELQAAYDEYKKAMAMTPEEREKAYRTTTVHDNGTTEVYNEMAVIINKILADRKEKGLSNGNYHFKPGYDLMQDENGLHYLKSVIDGHEVHIGEHCDDGWQYIGENDCRADMIHWYRLTHPNTDFTDDTIAGLYGL